MSYLLKYKCLNCGYEFEAKRKRKKCPKCKSTNIKFIQNVEVEKENDEIIIKENTIEETKEDKDIEKLLEKAIEKENIDSEIQKETKEFKADTRSFFREEENLGEDTFIYLFDFLDDFSNEKTSKETRRTLSKITTKFFEKWIGLNDKYAILVIFLITVVPYLFKIIFKKRKKQKTEKSSIDVENSKEVSYDEKLIHKLYS